MTRRILAVTARWHADMPAGFAVSVYFETPELGEHFARQLEVALEGLDRYHGWSPEVAAAQLQDIGRLAEADRDETIRRRAVGIVAWLVERGHLAPDANSGIEWHRAAPVLDEPTVVAMPVPPRARTARKKTKTASPRAGGADGGEGAEMAESAKPAKKKSARKTARKKPLKA